ALIFHSAPELDAGSTAYTGPDSKGANVYYKAVADSLVSMMDEIQSRVAQSLGLQTDVDGKLSPFDDLETAALQYLYGPSHTVRTGNDTYKLDASTSNFLWDGEGTDTIDGSILSQNLTLHLEAGHWDYIGSKATSITNAGQITVNY